MFKSRTSQSFFIASPQTIHVGSNQSVGFRTQQGESYGQNTKCRVYFKVRRRSIASSAERHFFSDLFFTFKLLIALMQRTSACPSLVVSCPKFDLAHSKANCKGRKGDFLSLGSQRLGTNTKVTDLAVIYVSQVLPKERAKKFQLQCRSAHCHLQIKHDRRG